MYILVSSFDYYVYESDVLKCSHIRKVNLVLRAAT
jgi:hypothetical protein